MKPINIQSVLAKAQALYKKDTKGAEMLCTGAALKRPTQPEEFIVAPEGHPWKSLTGLMGLPYGYIVQIAGAYDSGKSTVAGEFMAAAQKQGVYVVLLDTEKKFDKVRFEKHFNGSAKDLLIVQSTMIRKGVGGVIKFVDAIKETDPKAKILIVHDSVGGSVSRARAERSIDDEKNQQPGSEAVENSDYMKTIIANFDRYPDSISLLLINQMTDKIGFGQKGQSRSGGHKISFHSSMIIEMKKVKELDKVVNKVKMKTGIISQAKIVKNHLSQTDLSVAQMNIAVDAKGWHSTDFSFDRGTNDEESEE